MRRLLAVLLLLSAGAFAQTTCVNCGGLTNITEVPTTSVTATTPILFPDGAAGAPSISFTNNPTWGLWRDSSGIEASMNGINYWRWTSAGEFHINGNATGTSAGLYIDNGLGTSVGQINRASAGGLNIISNAAAPLSISVGSSGTGININYGAGASTVTIGGTAAASPAAKVLTIGESSRGGTDSNTAGASGTLKPGIGTGLGAGTKLCIQRDIMGATGSVAQSTIDGYCVGPSKTLSNTSATAQSLVNISVPSNSAGGVEGTITVTCTDGTNFDAETQSFNTSFVNKAGALTVTAPVITATSAANNSGSCTAGITAVAGTNSVDIKVTPVFGTIVPTTVTSYIALRNNGTGNATFN